MRAPRMRGDNDVAYFDSEILAARNWLSALIAIDCLVPEVFNAMLELKPAVLATTWKLRRSKTRTMSAGPSLMYPKPPS